MAAKVSSTTSSQIKQSRWYHEVNNKRKFDHNHYHNVQNNLNVHKVLCKKDNTGIYLHISS